MTNHLLCCDWGTSSFRLQLINTSDYQSIGEIHVPMGVSVTFDNWKKLGAFAGMSREQFFRQQLGQQIDLLASTVSMSLAMIPIVISGMASSSIGMEQVPYATLPFAVDGSQASIRRFDPQPDFLHEIVLISGVKSDDDVMRGEETQLIGLITLLDLSDTKTEDAIFIFPGTHSKHIHVKNHHIIQFETYMTGEIFNLMANQSILKDSIEMNTISELSDTNISAFNLGVSQSINSVILNKLFTVRTNQLFDKLTKQQNAFYLSGLLIGAELNHLQKSESGTIVLCGGSNLSNFYKLAIGELQLANRATILPADLIDKAATVGQVRLFQNQGLKESIE